MKKTTQGILAGAIGGLVGTWAMSQAQRGWTRAVEGDPPESAGGKHDARDWQERDEGRNANELAAQAIASRVLGRCLTRDELAIAAPACHYAFGTTMGALYGLYAHRARGGRTANGLGLAIGVWLLADEIAMPLLGLSRPTTQRPTEMHLQSLAAHLVYGATTEAVRGPVRSLLGKRHTYAFSGKSVLITGGSRGLGLVLARQLAHAGARLTLVARDQAHLETAAQQIGREVPSAEVLIISADVRDRDAVQRAITQAAHRFGAIDVLINNAGVIQVGPLDNMTVADFDDAMKTHFWGPLYGVLAALPYMRRQGEGRIVNISSVGGRIATPHMLPYSASKFALTGLSDGLRAELAHENISVTTVCPGLMRTGSPPNASFKGQRAKEYGWFAVSDSLPGVSINAERAARQILRACRDGEAELVITPHAKAAIVGRTLAPEFTAGATALINDLLPSPAGSDGDRAQRGRDTGSSLANSPLVATTNAAAMRNNEL